MMLTLCMCIDLDAYIVEHVHLNTCCQNSGVVVKLSLHDGHAFNRAFIS